MFSHYMDVLFHVTILQVILRQDNIWNKRFRFQMHMLPSFYAKIPVRNCDKTLYINAIFGNYKKIKTLKYKLNYS